jgi:hypothetical protein
MDIWRDGFRKRLAATVTKRWGSPAAAIEAGAATKSLYRWLDPENKAVPRSDDLWMLCERGGISAVDILLGVPAEAAKTVGAFLRSRAPDCIPDHLREQFGGLVGLVGHDLGSKWESQAVRATLRLVTATLAELYRARGDGALTRDREAMLAHFAEWHGSEGVRSYLQFSLWAAERVVDLQSAMRPKVPKSPRAGSSRSPKARKPAPNKQRR